MSSDYLKKEKKKKEKKKMRRRQFIYDRRGEMSVKRQKCYFKERNSQKTLFAIMIKTASFIDYTNSVLDSMATR